MVVASIIGKNYVSDETLTGKCHTTRPIAGLKRDASNDGECGEKNSKFKSVEPEPSKKPRLEPVKESDERNKKDADEDFQTTFS